MRFSLMRRQAASSPGASIALALIVLVAAGLFTAWPRLQQSTFNDEINYQIDQTPAPVRALTGGYSGWFLDQDPDAWSRLDASLADAVADGGPALAASAGTPRYSVTSDEPFLPTLPNGLPSDLVEAGLLLRIDPGIADHLRMVEGDLPAPSPVDDLINEAQNQEEWDALLTGTFPATDIILSVETAERLGLAVGDVLVLPRFGGGAEIPLRLSGVFEPADPADPQWQFQLNTVRPLIIDDPNTGLHLTATGYVSPETVAWLTNTGLAAMSAEFWIPIEPTTTDTLALIADLRSFTGTPQSLDYSSHSPPVEVRFDSGLTDVLSGATARWQGTAAVLTMVAAGPAGVVFAILALGARLAVSRRRTTLALLSARGGSGGQVRGMLALEGLVLGLPAAALGAVLATALVPSPQPGWTDYLLPAAAGLAPAVFLAASPVPSLRASRPDLSARSTSRWRWVVEVVVLALAAAAVYLMLQRGIGDATAEADPVATATPLLLALAACVIALRLYPVPLRMVHALTRSRRRLGGFLGSARAIREGSAGVVPMLALIVGISIAVFSTTMITTLRSGTDSGALADAGADIRMSGPVYSEELIAQIAATDGVTDVAAVTAIPNTPLSEDGTIRRLDLYAVDSDALARVQEDVPGALDVSELATPDGDSLPIVVSTGHEVETEVPLELVFSDAVPVSVVGQAEAASGVAEGRSWAVVDLGLLRGATGQNLSPRLLLVDVADDADPALIAETLHDVVGGEGQVTSPAQNAADVFASPSAGSMIRGFVIALVVSVLLSIVALVMTLVLAAPARGRLMAVLRTLGVGPGLTRSLVAWETAPLTVVAIVVGTALGLVLPQLVGATVDLRPFTGDDAQPPIIYDPLLLVGVIAGVVAILAGCVVLASGIARRLSLSVLRIGDAQ
ncbi:ABC transporter permease [Occultella aeris]|uniref:FtsX-like permease family protein n=1 Tax=Occultella aeris TaxID=2761496 RepID=A0A7M4DNA6_9MICO|nr:ABC transporter permease [Occultella aeris]VZO38917.1 FtsX-like permease family protein [Occultella aeris]